VQSCDNKQKRDIAMLDKSIINHLKQKATSQKQASKKTPIINDLSDRKYFVKKD